MTKIINPPPPPEPGEAGLRAKDLKNRIVVLRVTGEGLDETKLDSRGRPWEWTECDCWILDRSGIEHFEPGLRISWWRVRDQLAHADGDLLGGKVSEQEDNSITLAVPDAAWQKIIESVTDEILSWGEQASFGDEQPF